MAERHANEIGASSQVTHKLNEYEMDDWIYAEKEEKETAQRNYWYCVTLVTKKCRLRFINIINPDLLGR